VTARLAWHPRFRGEALAAYAKTRVTHAVRTTPDCGPHCTAREYRRMVRYLPPPGYYPVRSEYHCGCRQCHGKEDYGTNAEDL
jgi:hypothetical protein